MQSFNGLKNFKISCITIKPFLARLFQAPVGISKYLILLLNSTSSISWHCSHNISKYLILLLNRDDRLRCCGTHTISKYLILLLNPVLKSNANPIIEFQISYITIKLDIAAGGRLPYFEFQNILYYY